MICNYCNISKSNSEQVLSINYIPFFLNVYPRIYKFVFNRAKFDIYLTSSQINVDIYDSNFQNSIDLDLNSNSKFDFDFIRFPFYVLKDLSQTNYFSNQNLVEHFKESCFYKNFISKNSEFIINQENFKQKLLNAKNTLDFIDKQLEHLFPFLSNF